MAIHGRTRSAAYNGLADWEYIRQVKETSPIPIIGNGDLVSADLTVRRLQQSGCDAVMIGRGCLKNPFLFLEAFQLRNQSADANPPRALNRNYHAVFERLRMHLEAFYDEKRLLIQLKKFASWYSAGFPESASFRKNLFKIAAKEELLSTIREYFSELSETNRKDTSSEAFLMGGHG